MRTLARRKANQATTSVRPLTPRAIVVNFTSARERSFLVLTRRGSRVHAEVSVCCVCRGFVHFVACQFKRPGIAANLDKKWGKQQHYRHNRLLEGTFC